MTYNIILKLLLNETNRTKQKKTYLNGKDTISGFILSNYA